MNTISERRTYAREQYAVMNTTPDIPLWAQGKQGTYIELPTHTLYSETPATSVSDIILKQGSIITLGFPSDSEPHSELVTVDIARMRERPELGKQDKAKIIHHYGKLPDQPINLTHAYTTGWNIRTNALSIATVKLEQHIVRIHVENRYMPLGILLHAEETCTIVMDREGKPPVSLIVKDFSADISKVDNVTPYPHSAVQFNETRDYNSIIDHGRYGYSRAWVEKQDAHCIFTLLTAPTGLARG